MSGPPFFQCPRCGRPPGACVCDGVVLTVPQVTRCPRPACHTVLTGEPCRCRPFLVRALLLIGARP